MSLPPNAQPRPPKRCYWHALLAVLICGFFLAPLVALLLPGGPWSAPSSAGLAEIARQSLAASLLVTASAAVLAVLIGSLLAAVFCLTDLPGSRLWATVALLPFVCPPMVWALGQLYAFGPSGLVERWLGVAWRAVCAQSDAGHYVATALILAEVHAPLAMLIVGRGMGRLHQAGLASACLFLSPSALLRWMAGALRYELIAAFLLILALALGNHAVPHVLQCRLYPVEIYLRITNYLDAAGASWVALPLCAATLASAACLAVVERPGGSVLAGPSSPERCMRLGRKAWGVMLGLALYLGLTTVLPVSAMVVECRSPALFSQAVSAAAQETWNSLGFALAAALVAAMAGLVVGLMAAKCSYAAVQVLVIMPLGVPPILLALAYAQAYNRPWPIDLTAVSNLGVLVVLGLGCRGWPFAARVIAAGHQRMAPEWNEAAELAGLRRLARWRWLTGPLLAEHVVAGALIAFLLALGDVEITQMLTAPGSGTLALRLFSFLHFGPTHVAASLALWHMTLAVTPVLIYYLLTNRTLRIV